MIAATAMLVIAFTPPALAVVPAADTQELACIVMRADGMPLEDRTSPLDSVSFTIARSPVKICYSRPAARGRTMLGDEDVPYGEIWRTGANEPTMIHTTVDLLVAGIRISPGSYSLYTVPDEGQWEVILNRSITQWGHESQYTEDVREMEVGRTGVPSEQMDGHVETFTIRVEPASDNRAVVVLEWEHTQVLIPVSKG